MIDKEFAVVSMKRLLIKALRNKFDMEKADAISIAKTVEDIFNGQDEVEDMDIDKHVRSLFYELHREKLLKLRREEIKEKGKSIRKYYWSFDTKAIRKGAYEVAPEEEPYSIYEKIPKSAWLARQSCNT